MIVSNFELLIKRIATVPASTPTSISSVFRRVVQGYFLSVTNLEPERRAGFFLRITITSSTGNRIISNANTQCFFDNGNTNNSQLNVNNISSLTPNILRYSTSAFVLGPQQTGLITLLPNVIPFINTINPDLEIRGFVELIQSRFTGGPGIPFPFVKVPEVKVLTTPETRGSFLDNAYPSNNQNDELDFDQIAYGIATASGKTENIVEELPAVNIQSALGNTGSIGAAELGKILTANNPGITESEINDLVATLTQMKANPDLRKLVDKIKIDK